MRGRWTGVWWSRGGEGCPYTQTVAWLVITVTPGSPRQVFEEHGEVEEVFIMRGGSRSGMVCAFV